MAGVTGLEAFFAPKAVGVVGASRTPGKVGHEILAALIAGGFEGPILPINPNAEEIEGLACYPDLASAEPTPDLVIVTIPAPGVLETVRQCSRLGIKAMVIISSGFRESGDKGNRLERILLQEARRAGIRILGPNCIGLMVPGQKLNASFGGQLPPPGRVAYFSQSGSLLAAMADMGREYDLGFSRMLSIGNKADIDEVEAIKALGRDEQTHVIGGYLETIDDGDAFVREAERVSRDKPILIMKAGVTGAGERAASSHTGRLAGMEMAYECIFERAGVVRCGSIKAQFDYARAFATQPLPDGHHVAIIANAGGAGIMAADAIEREGLALAELANETTRTLTETLPETASTNNPVDILGDALADRYEFALNTVLDDDAVHSVLVLLSPHAMTECDATAEAVARVTSDKPNKPVVACFLGARRVENAKTVLRRAGVPHYDSPEAAVATLKVMADYARWRRRPKRVVKLFPVNRRKVETIIDRHLRQGAEDVGEADAHDILEAYGFVTPRGQVATSSEQAVNFAEQIGYPVVLKIWSPDILHKSEVDGVKVALTSAQEVMDAFDLMMYRIPRKVPDADIIGVLIQEMFTSGQELVLGMNRDPRFGPLMMVGMGGVMVEVLKDVAFYPAPLTAQEAMEMLVRTRTYHLLDSDNERQDVDFDAIAEGLQRLSQLVTEFPSFQEVDINPFLVGPPGTPPVAVDARMRVAKKQ
ncbi:MAG: acetate--CoA ligase family protein [Phycisphaerae bacterium]|nr:acetate--CoA ligase family protein [Phycisphaerae bacterium]